MTIYDLTLTELRAKLDSRELSAVEVTNAYLDRIATTNPALNTFITQCNETAIAEAQAADQAIAAGTASSLTGLPIAAKDIFNTEVCQQPVLRAYWTITYHLTMPRPSLASRSKRPLLSAS